MTSRWIVLMGISCLWLGVGTEKMPAATTPPLPDTTPASSRGPSPAPEEAIIAACEEEKDFITHAIFSLLDLYITNPSPADYTRELSSINQSLRTSLESWGREKVCSDPTPKEADLHIDFLERCSSYAQPQSPSPISIKKGILDFLRTILNQFDYADIPLLTTDTQGETLLMKSAETDNTTRTATLLAALKETMPPKKYKALLVAKDNAGHDAFWHACHHHKKEAVQALLRAKKEAFPIEENRSAARTPDQNIALPISDLYKEHDREPWWSEEQPSQEAHHAPSKKKYIGGGILASAGAAYLVTELIRHLARKKAKIRSIQRKKRFDYRRITIPLAALIATGSGLYAWQQYHNGRA